MYRHARIHDEADVLDVATGSGYGCAVLSRRLGAGHVTSIDVDPHLTSTAGTRLNALGLHPRIHTMDATADLPGIDPDGTCHLTRGSWHATIHSASRGSPSAPAETGEPGP